MMTEQDIKELEKQLEQLKQQQATNCLVKNQLRTDDRGPNDLTRRIEELEEENSMLQRKVKKLQPIMMEQFRNKGAL